MKIFKHSTNTLIERCARALWFSHSLTHHHQHILHSSVRVIHIPKKKKNHFNFMIFRLIFSFRLIFTIFLNFLFRNFVSTTIYFNANARKRNANMISNNCISISWNWRWNDGLTIVNINVFVQLTLKHIHSNKYLVLCNHFNQFNILKSPIFVRNRQ